MEEQDFTKAQSAISKSIHRCIKRFGKIEKKLQQPWRNGADTIKEIHDAIERLNDLFPEVGKMPNVRIKLIIHMMNIIAASMETELKLQNLQKTAGQKPTHMG